MNTQPYVPPVKGKSAFNCPHCNAYANQQWGDAFIAGQRQVVNISFACCSHCKQYSIWKGNELIEPDTSQGPMPNPDIPDEIKHDYEEARSIISRSPRGAAALLRLVIQKLCIHLGEKGKNINDDIASLVRKGLNQKIQKSLDIVRVTGNESVHPGQIDLKDDTGTAQKLCSLVNIIADAMITQPKMVDELYDNMPEEKRKQIEDRDKPKSQ